MEFYISKYKIINASQKNGDLFDIPANTAFSIDGVWGDAFHLKTVLDIGDTFAQVSPEILSSAFVRSDFMTNQTNESA